MSTYAAQFTDGEGEVRLTGTITAPTAAQVPGAAPAASPTFTGTVTLPAAIHSGVLPAADPHVVGVWWNNAGVVTISAG